jgi:alanine racemase
MRTAWVEVDLDAFAHNLRRIREQVGGRALMPVVKANAYGHGLVPMGQAAAACGAEMLGVAIPEEGMELRAAGVTIPIVVLGLALPEQAADVVGNDLQAVVSSLDLARSLGEAARRRGRVVPLHVKVDTGMSRVGVAPEEALTLCRAVTSLPGARLAGVMTHFATSDEVDNRFSVEQLRQFLEIVAAVQETIRPAPLFHAANSGAIAAMPGSYLDMVRPGLASYGLPAIDPAIAPCPLGLRAALSVHARVTQIRELAAGRRVSYGGLYETNRPSRLGVLPIGYADGYRRALTNQGEVLVRGRRAPVRGRVCMDQIVVDLTEIPDAQVGDEAVLLGRQGADEITAWEVAAKVDTIVDEVLVGLGARLPRRYRRMEASSAFSSAASSASSASASSSSASVTAVRQTRT